MVGRCRFNRPFSLSSFTDIFGVHFQVRRPEGLALFEDALYWLSKGSGELNKCDVYGEHKGTCRTMALHLYDAKSLVVHHQARQPEGKGAYT